VTTSHIAVLMTCHNRRERTLACLDSLEAQTGLDHAVLQVVLVDAGSTDGTREAVAQRFPEVRIVARGPELFWNGGMRVALAVAYQADPDYYLWLNDDVELDRDAVATLVATHRGLTDEHRVPLILAGSTRDPVDGSVTYGGVNRPHRLRRMRYELVIPDGVPRPVETMNGNCVLVPRSVVGRIGNLASAYVHAFGDYDYGHRARHAGCEVWIPSGTVGTCSRNAAPPRAGSFTEHRRRMKSHAGGLPLTDWSAFARRWSGPLWPLQVVSPYVRRYAGWATGR
jgi:GT2 family glycosyltransferase